MNTSVSQIHALSLGVMKREYTVQKYKKLCKTINFVKMFYKPFLGAMRNNMEVGEKRGCVLTDDVYRTEEKP